LPKEKVQLQTHRSASPCIQQETIVNRYINPQFCGNKESYNALSINNFQIIPPCHLVSLEDKSKRWLFLHCHLKTIARLELAIMIIEKCVDDDL
jgi:hypothetical protein